MNGSFFTKNNRKMKKIAAIAAFLTFFLTTTSGQENLRFGFQLSPTFSWMTANTNKVNGSGTNLGLKMGMIGEYYFRENYAFSSGIGFGFNQGGVLQHERKGCYWPNSDLGLPIDTAAGCAVLPEGTRLRYKLQYLEIPIGLKMRTNEIGYVRYFLEPALTLGFKTQATGSAEGRGLGNDLEKLNIKSEVNGVNLSWGLGVGLEYYLSENVALVGGLAFQTGVSDVTKDGAVVYNEQTEQYDLRENSIGKIHNIIIRMAVMF